MCGSWRHHKPADNQHADQRQRYNILNKLPARNLTLAAFRFLLALHGHEWATVGVEWGVHASPPFARAALAAIMPAPTFANTGYGYIEYDKTSQNSEKKVLQFREKPNYETAKKFLQQGNFLWNGGIFIWSTASVLKAFETHQPKLHSLFANGLNDYNTETEAAFVSDNYKKAENISVDYAIMEPSENVYVIPANFDWNDLGTWGSLYDKITDQPTENAIVNARLLAENASGNLIKTDTNKIVVLDSLDDFIVVEEKEILLIFPKSKDQDIKELRKRVKDKFGDQHI